MAHMYMKDPTMNLITQYRLCFLILVSWGLVLYYENWILLIKVYVPSVARWEGGPSIAIPCCAKAYLPLQCQYTSHYTHPIPFQCVACYTASVLLTDGNANSMQEVLFADQLTRTDNAYRRLLLNAIPALTLNVMCDKRPGQMYVRSIILVS